WRHISESISRLVMGWDEEEASRVVSNLLRDSIELDRFREYWAACTKWDVTELLPRVTTPTLITGYKGHPVFGEENARQIAGVMPDCRVELIEGATSQERGLKHNLAVGRFLRLGMPRPEPQQLSEQATGGLRAILFTDLVGHTEMMQRLGDERGRELLREHERITRKLIREHDGNEVKTDGDSFMISFASVTSAVECAIALQRALAAHNATGAEPLVVRVGLNAGEPIEEDGDLFGSTVILAARIAAKAEAGEILVANAVRELSTGKGFLFADRGDFAAKGFEEPVRLYEVRWRD
ncbi:MAG: adenylate/guanylate cyclase domain-containing protein, partial [Chloroflexota bacterium]